MVKPKYNSIDLFAGCGGLSLGLESAGFMPVMFSELDKDTRESFKSNVLHDPDLIEIGNVKELIDNKSKILKTHLKNLKKIGIDEIDLVCGGPPCQAYSGIGHRRSYSTDRKNQPIAKLYVDMAKIIEVVNPKLFLFENVRGLLSARWTKEGEKGEIFKDVVKTFSSIEGYKIAWSLLHSKNYGVPQNRPRMFLVGVRNDLDFFKNYKPNLSGQQKILSPKYPKRKNVESLERAIEWGLLPREQDISECPDIEEAIGDLVDSGYKKNYNTKKYPHSALSDFQKKMRTDRKGKIKRKGIPISEHYYSKHSQKVESKFKFMIKNKIKRIKDLPKRYRINKFSQKVLPRKWDSSGPTITVTSLPDDYVHYEQPRILTVREWARLQTFPDYCVFHGKRTTGGIRRAGNPTKGIFDRDVPKYTQIGNAVPVSLASKIAKNLLIFLSN